MTEKEKWEKVIEGLEEVIAEAVYPDRPRKFMMSLELAEDALALLKEQEPITPHMVDWGIYECRKCKTRVDKTYKYCKCCGQAVKWDE